ncbi:MAG: c-type cytochrome [Verrucomicrobia bacterium]|nr:c-type cytochrome [Verrucomicrobiota bacterium]
MWGSTCHEPQGRASLSPASRTDVFQSRRAARRDWLALPRSWSVCRITLFFLSVVLAVGQSLDPDRINLMIEALSRLDPAQVNANPKLKDALQKVLDATRGTPRFVELAHKFQLKDQNRALLDFVVGSSDASACADALRFVLENQGVELIRNALDGTNTVNAIKLAEACGNVSAMQAVALLGPLLADSTREPALRKRAVQSLAQSQEGSSLLLKLAKEDKLGADLKLTASAELNRSRWPNVKAEAAQVLPLPRGRNAQPLPPIAELARMTGNARRGAEVFASAQVACINCHQVDGVGIDFGPRLSEVGTKLAREAIYEAILNPSAGISFGYEGWQVQLKDGEEAIGIIVSETNDELAVKAQTGIVTRYPKSQITRRDRMNTSIMPAGLEQAMTLQDLVDLVEYLSSLKKASQ